MRIGNPRAVSVQFCRTQMLSLRSRGTKFEAAENKKARRKLIPSGPSRKAVDGRDSIFLHAKEHPMAGVCCLKAQSDKRRSVISDRRYNRATARRWRACSSVLVTPKAYIRKCPQPIAVSAAPSFPCRQSTTLPFVHGVAGFAAFGARRRTRAGYYSASLAYVF